MPLAPQSKALLAGKPLAKRVVFSTKVALDWSMPCKRVISTRFTLATGKRPATEPFQTKASALAKLGALACSGAKRAKASAIRRISSFLAIANFLKASGCNGLIHGYIPRKFCFGAKCGIYD